MGESKGGCLGVRPLWTQKPVRVTKVIPAVIDDNGNEAEPAREYLEPTGETERVQTGWESWHEINRKFALSAIANPEPYFDLFRYYDITIGEDGTPNLELIRNG